MLASSTHDTKRSEDVRARIAVLSEVPDLWRRHLARWNRLNRGKRRQLAGGGAPTRNDEYLIYQTLLGVWSPHEPIDDLLARMRAYLIKATREEKRATSWLSPNEEYEGAVAEFVARLLQAPEHNAFYKDFVSLAELVSYFGHLNVLVQTILKLTSPGVPDIYQGAEALSLALVDPDNRRPVDYEAHARLLDELAQLAEPEATSRLTMALGSPYSSDAKLFVTSRLLQLRRELAELFARGEYVPLQTSGEHKDHVLAFARRHDRDIVVVMLAKWLATLMRASPQLPVGAVWGDTSVTIDAGVDALRDVFTGVELAASTEPLLIADAFRTAPFAVLRI